MDLGLKDKVALVAAAGQGLGYGTARELAKEGARVSICSHLEDEIQNEIENEIIKFAEESPEPDVADLNKYVLDDNPDPRWVGPLK